MEIQKAAQFIDDISSDGYFAVKSKDWYKNDAVLILTQYEISELHAALKEWVEQNNIVRVQTVAGINNKISQFLEETSARSENEA